jgi:hypothetical protein
MEGVSQQHRSNFELCALLESLSMTEDECLIGMQGRLRCPTFHVMQGWCLWTEGASQQQPCRRRNFELYALLLESLTMAEDECLIRSIAPPLSIRDVTK